MWWN